MRTREEEKSWEEKEVQVEGRDEREKSGRSVGGPGATIRISRYEV
jgi:hypothetical protein